MIQPGSVLLMNFRGVVQTKARPSIVVSTDLYHRIRPDVVIALVTTNLAEASQSTDYILQDWAAAGLHKPSAFRAFLTTEPRTDVFREIGQLSDRDWQAVQDRLRLALAK